MWSGGLLDPHARKHHDRKSDNHKKDGTEFSFIDTEEIGYQFDRVVAPAASTDSGTRTMIAGPRGFRQRYRTKALNQFAIGWCAS